MAKILRGHFCEQIWRRHAHLLNINFSTSQSEGEYNEELPNLDIFKEEINKINSHFYTMDIAKTKQGDWLIVELGDGQVAGLPDNADKDVFYKSIRICTNN